MMVVKVVDDSSFCFIVVFVFGLVVGMGFGIIVSGYMVVRGKLYKLGLFSKGFELNLNIFVGIGFDKLLLDMLNSVKFI